MYEKIIRKNYAIIIIIELDYTINPDKLKRQIQTNAGVGIVVF